MKKIIFLLAIMGVAKLSMAQYGDSFRSRVKLGFTVSPMVSILKPQESGVNRNSSKAGLNFGLMADFNLNERGTYAFSSGFQVLLAGSKLKYDAGKGLGDFKANPAEYNMKLTYIEIPLALKLKTDPDQGGIGFWGQFGTYLDFPVSGRADVISMGQTHDRVNILPQMNRINIGMLLGAGIEYPLGANLTGTAGITYQNGFVDVTRNGKWDDGRVNMNSLALRLGVFF
ncbi:porin family protein [Chitinophaga arvensicola]|uniref:Outer membrane protein beta-barrel domain-containing protein n=1 Tax=Chitinophaga arvensicola TaxID=29529 RepID=A0A1I0Q6U6_9BACT|nr:porin family protein [Chitinophaga arvensicola]SEW22513.1 Outer membrane protein beta-barrel domain-containing protein [Chitinophaga arvensicola]